MYFSLEIEDIELVGGGADVALFVPVGLKNTIELADHHVVADVKLAPLVEEGTIDVQLHDEGLLCAVVVSSFAFHDGIQLVDLIDDCDAIAAVSQLSWLHYPDIPHRTANR